MVGKQVVAIVNLKPCKLAGVVSEGMLLCAEDPEGNLSLLTTEKNFPGGFIYKLINLIEIAAVLFIKLK